MKAPILWPSPTGETTTCCAGLEISGFGGDVGGEIAEGPGHELAEGHQVHLVVAADGDSGGGDQLGGVERRAAGGVGHDADQQVGAGQAGEVVDVVAEAFVFEVVEGRGHFRPDDDFGRLRGLGERRGEGEADLVPDHAVERVGGPLLGFGDIGLNEQGGVRAAPRVRHARQEHEQEEGRAARAARGGAGGGWRAPARRPSGRRRTRCRRRR